MPCIVIIFWQKLNGHWESRKRLNVFTARMDDDHFEGVEQRRRGLLHEPRYGTAIVTALAEIDFHRGQGDRAVRLRLEVSGFHALQIAMLKTVASVAHQQQEGGR